MNKLELSHEALFYGAVLLGAKCIYGLKDPFYGSGEKKLLEYRDACRQELEDNHLGWMNFDGEFTLSEETAEYIRVVAFCEGCLQCQFAGSNPRREVLYFKENRVLRIREEQTTLQLEWVEAKKIPDDIISELELPKDIDNPLQEVISDVLFEEIKTAKYSANNTECNMPLEKALALLSEFLQGSKPANVFNWNNTSRDSVYCIVVLGDSTEKALLLLEGDDRARNRLIEKTIASATETMFKEYFTLWGIGGFEA